MGTKANPAPNDCYEKALPDEPMFTLLARDITAPATVRQWAFERNHRIRNGHCPASDSALVSEALDVAEAMIEWRDKNNGKWRAPVPLLEGLDDNNAS